MGLFSSRMTPEELARAKGQGGQNSATRRLAQQANGHGANSVDAAKAREELVRKYGERGANRLQEVELQSAGAAPKLLSKARWFG